MGNVRPYQTCARCVMDTSDSRIVFDRDGVCDHCRDFEQNVAAQWKRDVETGGLSDVLARVRNEGRGSDFDCIIGLSGGVDSSYMLHSAVREHGLRPLVFHVDGGWNSELATHNIRALVERLGVELFTEVIDWEEMRQFQLAFFRSGVPHIDIPQDHAFVATLYNFAERHNVRYILNGGNIATECVRNPMEWLYYGTDMLHLRDILRKHCEVELRSYPFSSIWRHKIYLRYVKRVEVIKPLNYMPYTKEAAAQILMDHYGWRPYPQKHFESRFTKFFEGYWLPTRFGFDTRRVQFSSLILTGQLDRTSALAALEKPAVGEEEAAKDFAYVAAKLRISEDELRGYLRMPKKFYWDYRNQEMLFRAGARVLKALGVERSVKR